jgi:hypothetical protein
VFPTVTRTADDVDSFTEAVDRVLAGLCFRFQPELVCVIRIKRWSITDGYGSSATAAFRSSTIVRRARASRSMRCGKTS